MVGEAGVLFSKIKYESKSIKNIYTQHLQPQRHYNVQPFNS